MNIRSFFKHFLTIFIIVNNFVYAQAEPAPRGPSSGVLILIIIIIGFIIFLSSKKLKKKHVDVVDEKKKDWTEQNYKMGGIILTVIGGAIGVWVFTRITSVYGKLHSWEPPFTEYETTTIIGACIAVLLIIIGLISLTKRKEQQRDYVEKDAHAEKIEEKTEAEKAAEIKKMKLAAAKREAALKIEEYKKKQDDDLQDDDFLKY